jgi:hypothetical protein
VEKPEEPSPEQVAAALAEKHKKGANWFFWLAGLSVINSVLAVAGSDIRFIFGLGITQVVDAIGQVAAEDVGGAAKLMAFVASLVGAGVAALFGVLARKRIHQLYVLGMLIYLADGGLMLLAQDWLGAAFHAFVLLGLCGGLSASRKLRQLEQTALPMAAAATTPPTIDIEDSTPIR